MKLELTFVQKKETLYPRWSSLFKIMLPIVSFKANSMAEKKYKDVSPILIYKHSGRVENERYICVCVCVCVCIGEHHLRVSLYLLIVHGKR